MKYGLGRTAGASTIKLYGLIFTEKMKLSSTKFCFFVMVRINHYCNGKFLLKEAFVW